MPPPQPVFNQMVSSMPVITCDWSHAPTQHSVSVGGEEMDSTGEREKVELSALEGEKLIDTSAVRPLRKYRRKKKQHSKSAQKLFLLMFEEFICKNR